MDWYDYVCGRIGLKGGFYDPMPPDAFEHPNVRMIPWFEEKVLEHKNGHYIIQDWMGAILEISDKYDYTYIRNAIDFVTRRWIKCPVETPDDWAEMKKRYDPNAPERVKTYTPEEVAAINSRGRFISVHVNGPFWQLREWMGFEGLCIAMLDEPDFVMEMIEFWQDFVLKVLGRMFAQGIAPDSVWFSEDMAYKAHSMISPAMTREFLQPVYVEWVKKLREHNVPVIDMDSDGYIEELIPIWIDSGINVCDPIEVAAHNDIVKFRGMFGKAMAYTGGIDKRAIAAGGSTMRGEVMRVVPPLLRDGGYIPGCDHGVPPDISWKNYIEFGRLIAKLSGWL
jgi:uroporphyrinogen decarboxylase